MSNVRTAASLLLSFALLAPAGAEAAAVINEVAWMGTSVSESDEWIELYNDGADAVSLAGWTLKGTTAPNITLSGSIGAGAYYLLERTDDASVPGVTADKIYTGALANGGDTLTLRDSSGAVVDTVVGGTDWKTIGGSNTSKQTPQRNGSSWVTGVATAKALNVSSGSSPDDTATTTDTTTDTATTTPIVTIGGSAPSTASTAKSPARTLSLDAGPDRIVLANVPTPFEAIAYDDNGRKEDDAEIRWNFGDGTGNVGEEVSHTFAAPGEYAVTVRAKEGEAEVLRTLRVVVEEAHISAEQSLHGAKLINSGARLADVSSWVLKAGGNTFTLPPDTALLPKSAVVLVPEVTGLSTTTALTLSYPRGKVVSIGEPVPVVVATTTVPVKVTAAPKPLPKKVSIQKVQKVELPAPNVPIQIHEEVVEAPAAPKLSAAVGAAVPAVKAPGPAWFWCVFGSLYSCTSAIAKP